MNNGFSWKILSIQFSCKLKGWKRLLDINLIVIFGEGFTRFDELGMDSIFLKGDCRYRKFRLSHQLCFISSGIIDLWTSMISYFWTLIPLGWFDA